jgi:hypothetical protein
MTAMRGWIRAIAIGAAGFGACSFHPNSAASDDDNNTGSDASVPSDAPADAQPDADLACGVPPTCAGSDVLNECVGSQGAAQNVTCAWGCVGSDAFSNEPHCAELVPAGGIATASDPLGSDVLAFTIPVAGATIDTRSGLITSGTATLRPAGTGVKMGVDYEQRTTGVVFRFGSLTISGPVTFAYDGGNNPPVALVSTSTLDVEAAIDGQGTCHNNGGVGGPGGFRGGNSNGVGSGGGKAGADQAQGGGGGGNGMVGGSGGDAETGSAPAGGSAFGSAMIPVLIGGGAGGGGGNDGNAFGGGGGGAIQLVAETTLTIGSNGSINAGGCGGTSGDDGGGGAGGGGGGGGAGGTILLEANQLSIFGKLAVNGGGGGASDSTDGNQNFGSNGQLSRSPAAGSTDTNGGGTGGNGGYIGAAGNGTGVNNFGGGGGGGAGRIRFNTYLGSAAIDGNAVISPDLADANTTCTQGSAATQ